MTAKRIDYVIVLDCKIKSTRKRKSAATFLNSLQEMGLEFRVQYGKVVKENIYITIHLPAKTIRSLADMYNINIHNSGHTYLPQSTLNIFDVKLVHTPLSQNRDIFLRKGADDVTTMERILIVQEALNEAKFGEDENDYGIEKLTQLHVIKTSYPVHDGDFCREDGEEGFANIPENDRQLLLKYWANFSLWYKVQPLNLIQKYFGSEVAFYFAWLGFYNKMLVPAAAVGLICSIICIIQLFAFDERVDDVCNSKVMMCPRCHSGRNCVFRPLNISCHYTKVAILFDNHATVAFAVFMSFWATLFTNLWKRFENTLKVQWNVEFEEIDTKIRTQYKEKCTHKRLSEVTDKMEPYTPMKLKIFYRTLSYGTCLLLFGVVIVFLFSVIMYRVSVTVAIRLSGSESLEVHSQLLLTVTSACLQVLFIKWFGMFYSELSEWLTNLENPRTQSEFDKSVISKRYFLGFANNYAPLFYTAFVMGLFYSPSIKRSSTRYEIDVCDSTGCLMPLCTLLIVFMLFKSLFGNILTLVVPKIRKRLPLLKRSNETEQQIEKEYKLIPAGRYLLTTEFMEMILQYGLVTFFVAAFPLAPLCALINNCLELRLDAYKLVTRYRRPVPRQHSGIGLWNDILSIITHLSVATNAFVLAFTSDFVVREIYKSSHNYSLDGYIESTLSLYDMRDYKGPLRGTIPRNRVTNSTLCYYKASRYPPDHPKKYELTPDYYYQTGMCLVCVLVFEHVIMITNGFLSYFIPDLPQNVKETLHHQKNQELELKLKAQSAASKKIRRRSFIAIKRTIN